MTKPRLILTHGEKGGVGKTTTARVIADFLTSRDLAFRGYDTEGPTGQFLRFHGSVTLPVNVTDAASVAPVLDQLMAESNSRRALVDLGARTGADIKAWLYRGGALEEAAAGELGITVCYVVGNAVDSVWHLKECFSSIGAEVDYLVVRNLGVAPKFDVYDGSQIRQEILNAGGREITLPALDPAVFQSVDKASLPFSDFVENRGGSFGYTERRYCRTWLRECFTEFEKVADWLR